MKLKIDRMEIDDVGGDPIKLADAVLKQLPETDHPVPVREIAAAIDIVEIREELLDGLEGGLIVPEDKSNGAILVRRDRHEARKRYTIAHELGHYVNPYHKSNSREGFRCGPKDMSRDRFDPNDKAAKMEVQANQFAGELLMPRREVAKFLLRTGAPDIGSIIEMAERRFDVSREAAARRYVAQLDEPAAIVFSHKGRIRYVKPNNSFPRTSVWNGDPVPSASYSANSEKGLGEVTEWAEAPGHIWLEQSRGLTVFEQTLAQREGFRMTLLTVESDEVEEEWERPSFYR